MPRYTRSSVEAVRDAVDMIDLVSARTELRKAGARSYSGICPFHEERSPSFSVEPVEKLYHCFGCQAGGDAFKFVQEIEGVGFNDAVELLAQRYGVQLEVEAEDPRDAERRLARERLLELLERTAAFYVRYLWDSHEARHARDYLLERGLEEATLREFRVGYAPSAWDKVLLASRKAAFSNREIYDAGLATRGNGGQIYDRFRARITFPLCDSRGRVLGFGARAMGEARGAKYVNTPENDIFHKGRVLFGSDHARASAARAGRVIAVEGYTDVLALHQAGLRNCVGIMGTALTEDQVGELSRLAQVVLLALDSDSAGHEAMLRAARVAEGRKLELRVVSLPQGKDPADMVGEAGGAARLTELVDGSMPSCASASSARWRPATFATQRARTTSSRSSGPCSRRSRRASCARSCSRCWPTGCRSRRSSWGRCSRRAGGSPSRHRSRVAPPARRAGCLRRSSPSASSWPTASRSPSSGRRPWRSSSSTGTSRRSRRGAWRHISATTA